MIHNNYPTYEAGINVTLPIRNRAAQADNAQAQLTQRQQETQYRQTQNTIVLNVRQTLIALLQGRAAVTAAEQAEMLAQQTFDDEQKKYQLGSSTSYNVVLRTRDLTAAQGTLLRDRINLVEAEVNFNQSMGRTLDVNNITIEDAKRGKVAPVPNIPGSIGGTECTAWQTMTLRHLVWRLREEFYPEKHPYDRDDRLRHLRYDPSPAPGPGRRRLPAG